DAALPQVVGPAVALPARVSRPVQRPEHLGGQAADVLHDVDLARLGPADLVDVGPEHPECGPQAGALRDLDARLEAAVGRLETILGQQAGRGVLAGPAIAREGAVGLVDRDLQVALAIGEDVARATGVVLQLVVAPAGNPIDGAVARLLAPEAGVERGA